MASSSLTVDVQPLPPFNALKMTWQHEVNAADVGPAFEKILEALRTADAPIVVVVDLRNNPRFPVKETLDVANVAYRHPMLGEWLVIGSNWMGRAIERTLSSLTRRRNVQWFDTEEAVLAYLEQKPAPAP